MPGLLKTVAPANSSFLEATVCSVDILRFCCEVQTLFGQKLNNVQWLMSKGGNSREGDHLTPSVGDRVLICFSLSYPIIIGFLPGPEVFNQYTNNLDSGLGIDTGDLSPSQTPQARSNPGKPEDMSVGDRMWTSKGGGLIALLRHGTVILKSSRLAQIVISKFDDLVRIVGRNLETFSDTFIDVAYNVKGRIYRFIGYSETPVKVRNDDYSYQEILGDTAMGEYANHEGFTKDFGAAPVANTKIKKIRVVNGGTEVYSHVLDLNGDVKDTVTGVGVTTVEQTDTFIELITSNGGTSRVTLDGTKIEIDHENSNALLDAGKIQLTHGGSTVVMDATKIQSTHASSDVLIDSTGVYITSNGHFVNVTASGVATG